MFTKIIARISTIEFQIWSFLRKANFANEIEFHENYKIIQFGLNAVFDFPTVNLKLLLLHWTTLTESGFAASTCRCPRNG